MRGIWVQYGQKYVQEPMWEGSGSNVGCSSKDTNDTVVKGSQMGFIWAIDGFRSPRGRNMGPVWAEVCAITHMGQKWFEYGLE